MEEGKESFSDTIAGMETDFSERMKEIVQDMEDTIDEMERADEMYQIDENNIQGLINSTASMKLQLIAEYREMGRAAAEAYRREVEQASPSKKFNKEVLTDSVICAIIFYNNRIGHPKRPTGQQEVIMEKFLSLPEKKQTAIRTAALFCFAKHGYDKASISDIAALSGISKASMFQYFGTKRALYEYLFHYCANQMKQAYDLPILDTNTDFFDRVWQASVMKVENLVKNPHVAAFIASAVNEQSPELRDILTEQMGAGEQYAQALVLRREDRVKFKHPEDAELVFQMLMMIGKGMSVSMESDGTTNFSAIMEDFKRVLSMLKRNFYKEEYLP